MATALSPFKSTINLHLLSSFLFQVTNNMSYPYDTKLPLKVMINKDNNKVLFAEANNDFINVLLSILALPLGKLEYNSICLGSIDTLSASLYKMDESHFCVPGAKQMLLNPRSWLSDCCRKLKLDVTCSPPNHYYVCSDTCLETGYENVSVYSDIARCDCGKWLRNETLVEESLCGGAFVTNSPFVVTDDLRVAPVLSGIFQTLSDLGIADIQGAEMRSMSFDKGEICKLLNLCLYSSTPLSDMVFKKTEATSPAAAKDESRIMLDHIPKEKLHSREMTLKVFLQKSTNKFLYVEATDEFVELLFNFLTLPLGGVEFLLGSNTCFKSIVNLYRSVANAINDECFTTPETKSRLINPRQPYGCKSKDRFLPLGDEDDVYPELHFETDFRYPQILRTTFCKKSYHKIDPFKWSEEVYMKKHSKFIVTDDLSVSPDMSTSIFILNELGVPFSDVKELELRIGLEEALSLLKASITSKTPLTDALVNPMLSKPPKLEHERKQEPLKTFPFM